MIILKILAGIAFVAIICAFITFCINHYLNFLSKENNKTSRLIIVLVLCCFISVMSYSIYLAIFEFLDLKQYIVNFFNLIDPFGEYSINSKFSDGNFDILERINAVFIVYLFLTISIIPISSVLYHVTKYVLGRS